MKNPGRLFSRGCSTLLLLLPATVLLVTCGPLNHIRDFVEPDVTPPLFLGIRTRNEGEIELTFDEPAYLEAEQIQIVPELGVLEILPEAERLIIQVSRQDPGREYLLEATISDEPGNGLTFIAAFYGYNPQVPALLINEFTTRGSGRHPDLVELKIMAAGNMGGITFYQGTPGNFQDRLVFPAFPVAEGEFILIHCKPQGIPEEINEREAKDASGGLDASERAYDFWIAGGRGLSGNNGALTLYDRPGGSILDGVLYSNRSSDSDRRYRGFGTRKTLERALELVEEGGWQITGEEVRPEDAVNPQGSTGTRSLCRDSNSTDTDSKRDWHIVPTRGYTFGADNSDEVYQ